MCCDANPHMCSEVYAVGKEKTTGKGHVPEYYSPKANQEPKRDKGKGKGKGPKGNGKRFQGECYHCGEYGHSQRYCEVEPSR